MTPIATRRYALLGAASLTLLAGTAFAQGINLSWRDCGSYGTLQRNFACDSNVGQDVLVGSAVSGVDMPQLSGMYAVIDLHTGFRLPDWWEIAAGGCRQGALTTDFTFGPGFVGCLDPWSGTATGGWSYDVVSLGQNRARIRLHCATPQPAAINDFDEYYCFKVILSRAGATGSGACGGCTQAACLNLRLIKLSQPAGLGDYDLIHPLTRSYVTWQNPQFFSCPEFDEPIVPARPQTWGAVKSLYR